MQRLQNKRVAILATNGFEESELFSPLEALKEAGAEVHVVSPENGEITGNRHFERGKSIKVDKNLASADIRDYDALVIPGGLFNPDALRQNDEALAFVKGAFERKLPVGSICHGPQVLISAGLVKGRKMTGFEAIQIDLKNAGADVSDEEVIVDRGLVTSRKPDDLPAFNAKLIEEIAEGRHSDRADAAA